MYNYLDSNGILASLFFPSLIILGSFFLLNLFLAVIMEAFSDTNKLQKEKERLRMMTLLGQKEDKRGGLLRKDSSV